VKIITTTLAHAGAAHKLRAALASARWADEHLVLDTSPDKPDVAEALKRESAGRIRKHSWRWRNDFAAARNALLDAARIYVEGVTWAITLDSDERLVCPDPAAFRAELEACQVDTCMAYHVSGIYPKERAFRLPAKAHWVGRTHECAVETGARHTFTGLRFDEERKGHQDYRAKLLRDEELLLLETTEKQGDPRWWYYLGETQASLGKHEPAVASYLRCADLKGWDEEGAWACYCAAKILLNEAENFQEWEEKRRRLQRVVEICAQGLARNACFPELMRLAALATFWAAEPHKATAWACAAIAIGDYKGCRSMAHRTSFRDVQSAWELPFDVLKFSASTQEERSVAALDQELAMMARWDGTPQQVALDRHSPACGDASGSLGKHSSKLSEMMKVNLYPLQHVGRADYANMNPSMCVHEGRIVCIVRTVNYHIDEAGSYVTLPEDEGVIKTENCLCELGTNLEPFTVRPIVDASGRSLFETLVRGYEDMRPISVDGKLYASATVRDSRLDMRCEIVVCELDGVARLDEPRITRAHLQHSEDNQKNWMPVEVDGDLCFVFWCDPTIVRRFNRETGQCDTAITSTPDMRLDHLRGGSQVVEVDGSFLAVTHEVVWLTGKRAYLHRFVRFDSDMRVVAVSPTWYLHALQIEFCSGMCKLDEGSGEEVRGEARLLLGFGVRDAEAHLVVVNIADALASTKTWKEWQS